MRVSWKHVWPCHVHMHACIHKLLVSCGNMHACILTYMYVPLQQEEQAALEARRLEMLREEEDAAKRDAERQRLLRQEVHT